MDLGDAAAWLPDLFASLCDALEPDLQVIVSSAWLTNSYREEEAIRCALRRSKPAAVDAAVLFYLQGSPRLDDAPVDIPAKDVLQRRFLVARCIDDVLADIQPGYRLRTPSPLLKAVRDHFVKTGRYSRNAEGLVIPRGPLSAFAAASPDPDAPRPVQSGDRMDQLFRCLLRIPPAEQHNAAFEVVYDRLRPRDDFPFEFQPKELRFAVVPWAEGPDDLVFRSTVLHGEPRLHADVCEESTEKLQSRARALVRRLDEEQVAVALLPELVLSPAAIDALARELKALRAEKDSPLRMVVAGSCLSEARHASSDLAFNECVVLGGLGQILWRQRKLNHYAMATARMKDYGLGAHVLDPADHKEHTQTCRIVQIRDGRLGRMLVLICEDLAQPRPGDRVLDAFRPDWVFTPVLDGELEVGRWIHQRAWPNAKRFNANGLIATSLVLPLRHAPTATTVGVGLCVSGDGSGRATVLHVDRSRPSPLIAWATWDPTAWRETWMVFKPE